MIPVCVSRCEDCTKVQCIVRPGCGERHDLVIGMADPFTDYDVYFTNLTNNITRSFRITSWAAGEIVFDMIPERAWLMGKSFRIVAIKFGTYEPAVLELYDYTTITCVEVDFANLYNSNGEPECPETQWFTPY